LARTAGLAAALLEAAALRVRAWCVACAALAFFFACLAAFLVAFANFRARLSTFLAARTCCFAASARAAAAVASAFRRCAATALFVPADLEVATVRCLASRLWPQSLAPVAPACHSLVHRRRPFLKAARGTRIREYRRFPRRRRRAASGTHATRRRTPAPSGNCATVPPKSWAGRYRLGRAP
jgi:hypothetical protein